MTRLFLFVVALVTLLASACSRPPAQAIGTPDNFVPSTIFLVHGLFSNSGQLDPILRTLQGQGFTCYALDIQPNDGSQPIEAQAEQVRTFIDSKVAPNQPIQLVGHSMGGLVALQYLQDRQTAKRCRGLMTIASPHNGTILASFHSGAAGRQMTYNSSYLKDLNSRPISYPMTTYRSSRDLIIIPNNSPAVPFATNKIIDSPGHNEVLREPAFLQSLVAEIALNEKRT